MPMSKSTEINSYVYLSASDYVTVKIIVSTDSNNHDFMFMADSL